MQFHKAPTSLFAEKHYPDMLSPEELDIYLDRGWYRMGQTIFTTHFLCFGKKFYSALWIRLFMTDFKYRKSQRKLIRKINERFNVKIAPFQLSKEKEQLYWRYKKEFKGFLAGSLEESLLDGEEISIYNTLEVQIYDEDKLIGLSFFDVGKESCASIMGVYDPKYSSYSLGYFTMLVEMQYCLDYNIPYYYPGYVVPGYDRFDYKTRIGDVEVFTMNNWSWVPFTKEHEQHTPIKRMENKLAVLAQTLETQNIQQHLYYYPLFEANLFGFWNTQYLDFPVFVKLFTADDDLQFFYFIAFDPRTDSYKMLRCQNIENHSFFFNQAYINTFLPDKFFMTLSSFNALLFETKEATDMAHLIKEKSHVFI